MKLFLSLLLSIALVPQKSSAQLAQILLERALIGATAIEGVKATWSEPRPYYCSRFVRQVMQQAFPLNALYIVTNFFGLTANETENKWKAMGKLRSYAVVYANGNLREGDVVFQSWSADGHVGVVVKVNGITMIAENTIRRGLVLTDFRALTTLQNFGPIRSVGRWTGFNF